MQKKAHKKKGHFLKEWWMGCVTTEVEGVEVPRWSPKPSLDQYKGVQMSLEQDRPASTNLDHGRPLQGHPEDKSPSALFVFIIIVSMKSSFIGQF